jgi:hypothetical protein
VTQWPFWLGGLVLATVPLLHWLWLRRTFAVSGRITAIVDRLRGKRRDAGLAQADLIAALRAETAAEFGEDAVEAPGSPASAGPPPAPIAASATFMIGLVLGGVVAAVLAGGWATHWTLRGGDFATMIGEHSTWALLLGGVLVGFGTRMAGGCTSGHGLCGTSRLQPGSLLATATFFGTGILISLAIGAVA